MAKRYQYQVTVRAPDQPDPSNFESFRHQPLSEPTRNFAAGKLAAAFIAAIAVGSVVLPPIQPQASDVSWTRAFNEPVRIKLGLRPEHQQTLAWAPFVENITVDKWFRPLSEPVRLKPRASDFPFSFQSIIQVTPATGLVSAPLDSIVFQGRPTLYQVFASPLTVETITVDKWFTPLEVPPKAKPRAAEYPAYHAAGTVETITVDKWFNPLEVPPVRIKRATDFPFSFQSLTQIPSPATGLVSTPLDSIVFQGKPTLYQVTAAPLAVETVTVDKWFIPFTDPAKPKPRTVEFPAFSFGTYSPVVNGPDQWWQNLATPPKAKPRTVEFQSLTIAPTQPEAKDQIAWWRNLETPPKAKPRAAEYPFLALAPTAVETITVDKWFVPLSERNVKTLQRTAEYQVFTYGPVPIVQTIDRWLQPWSEPSVKTKPRAVEFPSFTFGEPPLTATTDSWWQNLATPPKAKPRATEFLAFTYGPTPIVVPVDGWWQPLATPPKAKPRIIEFQPIAAVGAPAIPAITVVPIDRWLQQWSEPVRIKLALETAQQPWKVDVGAPAIPTITPLFEDKWHYAWSEPVRIRLGLRTGDQLTLAWSGFTPPIFEDKWHQRLSEPVRIKLGLRPEDQQTLAFVQAPPFGEVIIVSEWFVPLRDPVELKKRGLRADEQMFTTSGEPIIFRGFARGYIIS